MLYLLQHEDCGCKTTDEQHNAEHRCYCHAEAGAFAAMDDGRNPDQALWVQYESASKKALGWAP